jgi:single-stranded-DNA-specific exonuclease
MQPGLHALFAVAGRDPAQATAQDFGFALGPRINAAGRLSDMTLGIECLTTDDAGRAAELAQALDAINRERRTVEDTMREQAEAAMAQCPAPDGPLPALALHHPSFHEGVVGIVAGRLKEQLHRPVFVFATGQDGLLKGSGRSIEGFHLRDALDLISKRHPDAMVRFGGHAMAAGCTLHPQYLQTFTDALQDVARQWLDPATLQRRLSTDGLLPKECFTPDVVRLIAAQVWGQGFEAPVFCEPMTILNQRVLKDKHLKLMVRPADDPAAPPRDAIWFNRSESLPDAATLAYRLELNEWQGRVTVQMQVVAASA